MKHDDAVGAFLVKKQGPIRRRKRATRESEEDG